MNGSNNDNDNDTTTTTNNNNANPAVGKAGKGGIRGFSYFGFREGQSRV